MHIFWRMMGLPFRLFLVGSVHLLFARCPLNCTARINYSCCSWLQQFELRNYFLGLVRDLWSLPSQHLPCQLVVLSFNCKTRCFYISSERGRYGAHSRHATLYTVAITSGALANRRKLRIFRGSQENFAVLRGWHVLKNYLVEKPAWCCIPTPPPGADPFSIPLIRIFIPCFSCLDIDEAAVRQASG